MEQRTKTPDELTKVGGDGAGMDWLAEYSGEDDKSMEGMEEYRVLPRIKQIQGTTADELKDEHGEGSAIMIPGPVKVCGKEDNFTFVPVFMWTEFWLMSSLKDQGNGMILDKNNDKTGELASRSRDVDRRNFYYTVGEDGKPVECKRPEGEWKDGVGGTYQGRFVECLIFAIVITTLDHPLQGTGATLSFMKGEFNIGKAFINQIGMRKVPTPDGPRQAPLWSTQWVATPARRTRGSDQKWWGIDVTNADQPYINKEDGPFYLGMHQELKELHAKNAVGMDTSDMDDEATAGEARDAAGEKKF